MSDKTPTPNLFIGASIANIEAPFDISTGIEDTYEVHELRGFVVENGPDVPIIPRLHDRILEAIKANPDSFYMGMWHACTNAQGLTIYNKETQEPVHPNQAATVNACGTTHCHAGYIVHMAGDLGYQLEEALGDTGLAARLILARNYPWMKTDPDFHTGDDTALDEIKTIAVRARMAEAGWPESDLDAIEYNSIHCPDNEE